MKHAGSMTGEPQFAGDVPSGFGIPNRTLRIELSICSSFLYWCSPRLCRIGPSPICVSRSGLPNATTSGMTSVTVPSALRSTVMPSAGNTVFSWVAVYVPAGTVGSNSPWTMLCAR